MKEYYDCEPTLDDYQMLEVCKKGYLALEGVVPNEINERVCAYLETNTSYEPTAILLENWFVDAVIKQPQAVGAVRALLGKDFGLPSWHRDGGSKYTPEVMNLQVFYLPQTTTLELGPTEVLPGSHFLYSGSGYMGQLDKIKGTEFLSGPAGSIFITIYSIWHRRSSSTRATTSGIRNLLKYNYFRTTPPKRDWIINPDFDFAAAPYQPLNKTGYYPDRFRASYHVAEMFLWLCGKHDRFKLHGGQTWPVHMEHRTDRPYGIPEGL